MTITDLIENKINPQIAAPLTRQEYLCNHIKVDDGGYYSFEGHEALREPISCEKPEVTILKGAQLGFSVSAIGVCLCHCDQYGHNVGYFLPTDNLVDGFSSTKVDKTIMGDEHTRSIGPNLSRPGTKKKDKISLKRINNGFFALLGLESVINAISLSFDLIIFDEVDDLDENHMTFAEDRIKHSQYKRIIRLGVGRLPGAGIDAEYHRSDMRKMHYTCRKCGHDNMILEELFPHIMFQDPDGNYFVGCPRCKSEIDRDHDFVWKATNPKGDHPGFRVSQLNLGYTNLNDVMTGYEKALKKQTVRLPLFNCSVLAKPDAGLGKPITDEVLNSVTGEYFMQNRAQYSFVGVDRGNMCHIVVGYPVATKTYHEEGHGWAIIYFESCPETKLKERLNVLDRMFCFWACCLDSAPGTKAAFDIAIQPRWKRRTYLSKFIASQSFDIKHDYKPTEEDKECSQLKTNREESIGEYVDLFVKQGNGNKPRISLPCVAPHDAANLFEEFRNHHKLLEKVFPKGVTNPKYAKYRDKVDNHFAMAGVYMLLGYQAYMRDRRFAVGAMPASSQVRT